MRKDENGFVIVTLALLLVVLCGFTALAVDVGVLYSARTQAQGAADAAALAGATTFILDDNLSDQPGRAINNAKKVGAMNSTLKNSITEGEVAVNVDLANRRVKVNIARVEPTFFAKILNFNSANVSVEAIAEAALDITTGTCVKPIFIPNTIGAPNGTALCDACMANQTLVDKDTGAPTVPYGTETVANGGWLGRQMSIRPGAPTGAIAPGQFYSIEVTGPGADPYREAWAGCSTAQYQCGMAYPVKPGAMVGPTRHGIEGHAGDPGLLANSPGGDPDTWQDIGEYLHGGVQPPFDLSQQLVLTPIVDLCDFCPSGDFPTGQTTLTISGFAMMFVEGYQGNDVFARLVDVKGCDGGGAGVSGTTLFATPLRLVHE